ncbi:unnamed protein product [Trichogramma brassicae]|uniref:Major facilitator superfamily (MFS) profile domain-containing protein n=1 Tax=Trichogramma brassicae TaxID=86971 RepID=A0A6H5IC28_9HYME|nr:unnamed protein product [Trichogramma brassicae]
MPPSPMFPFDRFRDSANHPCHVSIVSDQASLDLALAPARQQEVPGSKHDNNHDSCSNSHKLTTAATVLTSKSLVKRIKQLLPQALSAFTVWIIIVEIGITCVWCSPYLAKLTASDSPLPLTDREASWVAAALFLGQLLGSVSGAVSVNFGGSKRTCLITALPMALGWILAYFAYSPGWLYASRFSSGIGSGLGFSCFPLYLGEVADPKVRGSLVSFAMMGAPVGNLLGSIIGSNMSLKMSSVVFLAPCVLLFLLLSVMPDSPHHLVKHGQLDEARWAIGWYRGCESTVEKELEETIIFVKSTEAISFKEKLGEFRYRHNQKATILVMSLFVFMQLSGLNDVLSYMEIILVRGKFVLYKASSVVSYAVAASVLTAICCIGLTDRFGRRLLLIVSSLGVALSLSILGTHFSFLEEAETYPGSQLLPMISVFLFIIFFTVGLSSIPSIVASEVYSANVKPLATCLVNLTSSAAALVAAKSFQPLVDLIGEAWVFYGHVLVTLMVVPFAVLFMPETKGKSLQQIQEDFLKNQYQVSCYVTPAMAVVYTYTRRRRPRGCYHCWLIIISVREGLKLRVWFRPITAEKFAISTITLWNSRAYSLMATSATKAATAAASEEEATTSSAAPLQCRMSTSKSIVARVRLLCPQVLAAVAGESNNEKKSVRHQPIAYKRVPYCRCFSFSLNSSSMADNVGNRHKHRVVVAVSGPAHGAGLAAAAEPHRGVVGRGAALPRPSDRLGHGRRQRRSVRQQEVVPVQRPADRRRLDTDLRGHLRGLALRGEDQSRPGFRLRLRLLLAVSRRGFGSENQHRLYYTRSVRSLQGCPRLVRHDWRVRGQFSRQRHRLQHESPDVERDVLRALRRARDHAGDHAGLAPPSGQAGQVRPGQEGDRVVSWLRPGREGAGRGQRVREIDRCGELLSELECV